MRHTTALLLALVALSVTAAPAPKPWVAGWDDPVDQPGDCRFDREGDKLTITVPGKDHGLDVSQGNLNAPRLLRDAAGNFVVQVRVAGTFTLAGKTDDDLFQRAGLVVSDGKQYLRFERAVEGKYGQSPLMAKVETLGQPGGGSIWNKGPALNSPAYLRIERRGDLFYLSFSADGNAWTRYGGGLGMGKLPERIKVGVIAEATTPDQFKAEFDQLELSTPRK